MTRPVWTAVLWNARASSAAGADVLRAELERRPRTAVVDAGDERAVDRVRELARRGIDLLVAAGGDGTVSWIVNELRDVLADARLAILPLGTGNDLCRTLGIPLDPTEALDAWDGGRELPMDLIEVAVATGTRLCANAVTGGNSARVSEETTEDTKKRWGPLSYAVRAVGILGELEVYHLAMKFDEAETERFEALNVVVANGRTAAGGFTIAPEARLDDGLLDVVIVRDTSIVDLAHLAARLVAGDYHETDAVVYRRARRVEIRSDPPMPLSCDGELIGDDPVVCTLVPGAVRVLAAPPEASSEAPTT